MSAAANAIAAPRSAGPGRATVLSLRRQFMIEARRSIALWLLPVMVGLGRWVIGRSMFVEPPLWANTRIAFGPAVVVMTPIVAGIGAWVGGRERRRGLGEALGTTSGPAFLRDVAAWAATAC